VNESTGTERTVELTFEALERLERFNQLDRAKDIGQSGSPPGDFHAC
jgi:hypothetical protein